MANASVKARTDSKSATVSELSAQVETLRDDLSALTKIITDLGKEKGDEAVLAAQLKAEQLRLKATEAGTAARKRANEAQEQATDFIRTQPATALGIAAAVGFLVGFFGSRK